MCIHQYRCEQAGHAEGFPVSKRCGRCNQVVKSAWGRCACQRVTEEAQMVTVHPGTTGAGR